MTPAPYQPKLRTLTRQEAIEQGHDVSEIDEFPIRKLSLPGASLQFEEGKDYIWVLCLGTEQGYRQQGRARTLLTTLVSYAITTDRVIEWGHFTEEGEKYLRHIVEELEEKHEQKTKACA